jgi:hypothetical protein
MAWLVPKAQMVPAVDPDNLHPDKAVVSSRRSSYLSTAAATVKYCTSSSKSNPDLPAQAAVAQCICTAG